MNMYAYFVRGAEHAAMCQTSIESVRKADRLAIIVVATDEQNPSWLLPSNIVLRVESGLPIMLANLEAQIACMAYAMEQREEQIVFLDTDTLMLKPIPNETTANLTLTWRDSIGVDDDGEKVEGIANRMPYNYGVMTAFPSLGALETLIWIRERIRVMSPQNQNWYGNQLAVAEFAGTRPKSGTTLESRRIPWKLTNPGKEVWVRKLPCETFNWTPQSEDEDVSGKYVLHFKGRKRHLMELYAKRLGLGWYAEKAAA